MTDRSDSAAAPRRDRVARCSGPDAAARDERHAICTNNQR
jgi:hypothetical protein